MNSDARPQDATVHVVCRYFAACQYQATGPNVDVTANYKQHLREQHQVAHPKVEEDELQASAVLADFDRSPAIMAALDPFPAKPWCGGEAVVDSFPGQALAHRERMAAAYGLPPGTVGAGPSCQVCADAPRAAMCQLEPGTEPRILDFQREGA